MGGCRAVFLFEKDAPVVWCVHGSVNACTTIRSGLAWRRDRERRRGRMIFDDAPFEKRMKATRVGDG